jgi:hypothetical protein
MKIKNYIWVVLIIGLIGIPSVAQRRRPEASRDTQVSRPAQGLPAPERAAAVDKSISVQPTSTQVLTASQRAAAINTSLSSTCAETAPTSPQPLSHNANVFSPQRLASTLNGVWIGKVSGEYDPQLFAPDGFLNVDYYMIVDVSRGEVFTYQEFTGRRSGAGLQALPGGPKWTYVWCARENYEAKSPRQIHDFVKVSDNVQDGRQLITNSTGLTFSPGEQMVLSNIWQRLVNVNFFDDPKRSLAYAGVLFKPVTMGTIQTASGGSLLELKLVGEYRGSGQTAAKFIPGQPIHNVEQAQFLGVSMGSGSGVTTGATSTATSSESSGIIGDFLTAAFGLGNAMFGPKPDADAPIFSTQMAFDKVVIGPLNASASTPVEPVPAEPSPATTSPTKAASPAKVRAGQGHRKLQ